MTVPGTKAAELVIPKLAAQLADLLEQRAQAADQVEKMLDAHPLATVLTSMPGVGVRTAARILLEVGDGSAFPTPGRLAAYAGLAPVTRRSGSSILASTPHEPGTRTSNAPCSCPRSPPCTTQPAAPTTTANEPKARNYAMLRDGTLYQTPTATAA